MRTPKGTLSFALRGMNSMMPKLRNTWCCAIAAVLIAAFAVPSLALETRSETDSADDIECIELAVSHESAPTRRSVHDGWDSPKAFDIENNHDFSALNRPFVPNRCEHSQRNGCGASLLV
jgi:hypothetical protein